jgi:ABC-type transport system involved in cytochrome c biogenesis ATPase subunit
VKGYVSPANAQIAFNRTVAQIKPKRCTQSCAYLDATLALRTTNTQVTIRSKATAFGAESSNEPTTIAAANKVRLATKAHHPAKNIDAD